MHNLLSSSNFICEDEKVPSADGNSNIRITGFALMGNYATEIVREISEVSYASGNAESNAYKVFDKIPLYVSKVKSVGRDFDLGKLVTLRETQRLCRISDDLVENLFREHVRKLVEEKIPVALGILKSHTRAVLGVIQVVEELKKKAVGDIAKMPKSSSSYMDIEIAELLYGLITSKNHESLSQKLEATINHNASIDVEKKKPEECNSTKEFIRILREQLEDVGCHDDNATCHENGSSELDVDKHDLGSTRVIPYALEDITKSKFEIDLMALPPPPMMLSREGNHFLRNSLTSEIKKWAPNLENMSEYSIKVEDKVEKVVTVEKVPGEIEDVNSVILA
ncbi:hypothetical protein RYX36_002731 [Vicia faba]